MQGIAVTTVWSEELWLPLAGLQLPDPKAHSVFLARSEALAYGCADPCSPPFILLHHGERVSVAPGMMSSKSQRAGRKRTVIFIIFLLTATGTRLQRRHHVLLPEGKDPKTQCAMRGQDGEGRGCWLSWEKPLQLDIGTQGPEGTPGHGVGGASGLGGIMWS